MKKLYALLAILIVIYIGVNFQYNGLDTINSLSHVNLNVGLSMDNGNDANSIKIGPSAFDKLENFHAERVTANEVKLVDTNKKISIRVCKLNDPQNMTKKVKHAIEKNNITSNQTVSQNGITAYFLYNEGPETYNADIYFIKEDKNYFISGDNIRYEDSDYFINSCKDIINSMRTSETINFNRF